jgi:hypothetical protein
MQHLTCGLNQSVVGLRFEGEKMIKTALVLIVCAILFSAIHFAPRSMNVPPCLIQSDFLVLTPDQLAAASRVSSLVCREMTETERIELNIK